VAEKTFIPATDLAAAVHLIMTEMTPDVTYSAGTEAAVSIRHIVEMTTASAGADFESFVTIAPARTTEDGIYWLDSMRIHDEHRWRPQISLAWGLVAMVKWARANLGALKLQTQQISLRS
jgi:nucleoside-diphosphate-sugar epimerase